MTPLKPLKLQCQLTYHQDAVRGSTPLSTHGNYRKNKFVSRKSSCYYEFLVDFLLESADCHVQYGHPEEPKSRNAVEIKAPYFHIYTVAVLYYE